MFEIKQNKYKSKCGKNFSIRLPQELFDKIESVAKSTGRKRNQVIRMCLEFALDNLEVKNNAER